MAHCEMPEFFRVIDLDWSTAGSYRNNDFASDLSAILNFGRNRFECQIFALSCNVFWIADHIEMMMVTGTFAKHVPLHSRYCICGRCKV